MREKGGILVWRAGAQSPSDGPGGRRKPKRKAHSGEDTRPAEKASKQIAGASKGPSSVVLRALLKPSDAQKVTLDTLFSGPVLLQSLLKAASVWPGTQAEASRFLLENHKALQPYLYANDRSTAVELLKKLVLDWRGDATGHIELEFSHDCSISAKNEVFLPIPRLGVLPVVNVAEMEAMRKGRRYKSSFVLINSSQGYIAEIEFQISAKRHSKALAPAAKTSGRIPFAQFMTMFDNALNARLMNELRISSRYVRPDFDALKGWPVQGGLPSLGKGR